MAVIDKKKKKKKVKSRKHKKKQGGSGLLGGFCGGLSGGLLRSSFEGSVGVNIWDFRRKLDERSL